jgi:hypothetical protein
LRKLSSAGDHTLGRRDKPARSFSAAANRSLVIVPSSNMARTFGADLVRVRALLRVLFCTILHTGDSRKPRFIGAAGKD